MTVMTLKDFGAHLLRSGDLDPVYVALHKSNLSQRCLARICAAYWCFYHLGLAASIAEADTAEEYWRRMQTAARNDSNPDGSKPFPRGSERRHFRGQQAISAMAELQARYPTGAEDMVKGFVQPDKSGAYTYDSVSSAVQTHRGFGPWIAFKIADMSERVLGYDTDFTNCHLGIYKDPRQGAAVAWLAELETSEQTKFDWNHRPWEYPIKDEELLKTVEHYVASYRAEGWTAPPSGNRLVNVQEIETIFCKYKSHLKGHYPLNKDTEELHHSMTGWGDLAEHVRSNLPEPV